MSEIHTSFAEGSRSHEALAPASKNSKSPVNWGFWIVIVCGVIMSLADVGGLWYGCWYISQGNGWVIIPLIFTLVLLTIGAYISFGMASDLEKVGRGKK